MKKSTKKEMKELVSQMEEKYFDLVWYARSSSTQKEIFEVRETIEFCYPDETRILSECQDNWEHGFNSGMLAGMRYVLTLMEEGKEQAEEEFPFLDT